MGSIAEVESSAQLAGAVAATPEAHQDFAELDARPGFVDARRRTLEQANRLIERACRCIGRLEIGPHT